MFNVKKMASFTVLCCKIYVHIWKSLNACMLCTVNTALKQESQDCQVCQH